jgi:hypothetical protein
LRKHFEATLALLRGASLIELLEVDYRDLLTTPDAIIDDIVSFLGPNRFPYRERMRSTVDPRLYRHRSTDEMPTNVTKSIPMSCPKAVSG